MSRTINPVAGTEGHGEVQVFVAIQAARCEALIAHASRRVCFLNSVMATHTVGVER